MLLKEHVALDGQTGGLVSGVGDPVGSSDGAQDGRALEINFGLNGELLDVDGQLEHVALSGELDLVAQRRVESVSKRSVLDLALGQQRHSVGGVVLGDLFLLSVKHVGKGRGRPADMTHSNTKEVVVCGNANVLPLLVVPLCVVGLGLEAVPGHVLNLSLEDSKVGQALGDQRVGGLGRPFSVATTAASSATAASASAAISGMSLATTAAAGFEGSTRSMSTGLPPSVLSGASAGTFSGLSGSAPARASSGR